MAQRRGISNVVATIILIAVAIALAVAVAIWVFGIFKGSAHATTLNAISEDLYVTNGGNYLVLYVSNPGGTTQNIVSVTLSGASCNFQGASTSASSPVSSGSVASSLLSSTIPGTVTAENNNEVVIAGGVMAYLVYTCGSPGSFTPGIQYSGTIYLSTGTNIPFTVTAQS
jgi:flagellin-like protein